MRYCTLFVRVVCVKAKHSILHTYTRTRARPRVGHISTHTGRGRAKPLCGACARATRTEQRKTRAHKCVMRRSPAQPAAALPTLGMLHASEAHFEDVVVEDEEIGSGELREDEVFSQLLISSVTISPTGGSQLLCRGGTRTMLGFAAVGLAVTGALLCVMRPVIEGAHADGMSPAFTHATTDYSWHRHPLEQSVACSDDSEADSMTSALLSSRFSNGSLAESRLGCKAITSAWVRSNAKERIMLVGPFVSEAMRWHWIDFPFDLLEARERVRGFTGDTVSADDWHTPIAYPPLHMHHIHVVREVRLRLHSPLV